MNLGIISRAPPSPRVTALAWKRALVPPISPTRTLAVPSPVAARTAREEGLPLQLLLQPNFGSGTKAFHPLLLASTHPRGPPEDKMEQRVTTGGSRLRPETATTPRAALREAIFLRTSGNAHVTLVVFCSWAGTRW